MIYGSVLKEKNEIAIVGATSLDEQIAFLAKVTEETPDLIQDTDFTRYLSDKELRDFKMAPTIMEFADADSMKAWGDQQGIEIVGIAYGPSKQAAMLLTQTFSVNDTRSIGEIYGITEENDPWSHRTEEQKAKAAANKKQMQDKRKAGDITGDSYGGGEKKGVQVRDVQVGVNEDGEVEFGKVLADKDLFGLKSYHLVLANNDIAAYADVVKRAGLMGEQEMPVEWEKHPSEGIIIRTSAAGGEKVRQSLEGIDFTMKEMKEETVADDDWKIADDEMVAIYFRVEAQGTTVAAVDPLVEAAGNRAAFRRRDVGDMCWFAYVREASAAAMVSLLADNAIESRIVEANAKGERIIEEGAGATVIDTGAAKIEPPMPWNEGAAVFAAMDEKEQRKSMTGDLFLYTIRDYGYPLGRLAHIVPKTYFKAHNRIWEGPLPIEHLLSGNLEPYEDVPGMFQCKSLDLIAADYTLGNKAKMTESLNLRMYVNVLPNGDQRQRDARVATEEN